MPPSARSRAWAAASIWGTPQPARVIVPTASLSALGRGPKRHRQLDGRRDRDHGKDDADAGKEVVRAHAGETR